MNSDFPRDEDDLASFMQAFEDGQLPKASWIHASHIAVATVYLRRCRGEALPTMRAAIVRYNQAVGTENSESSGYHETLTIFWLAVLAECLDSMDATSTVDAVCRLIGMFGGRRSLHTEYYSTDIVKSLEARRSWFPPDKKPLPGLASILRRQQA